MQYPFWVWDYNRVRDYEEQYPLSKIIFKQPLALWYGQRDKRPVKKLKESLQTQNLNAVDFVENFKDFKSQKITLSNIFSEYELIEEKAFSAIKDVLYHNLPKVSGIYCSTLNIDFPDYVNVFKAVTIRHDLVHRGGKTKDGNYHKVKPVQVDRLLKDVRDFYSSLENAIEKI